MLPRGIQLLSRRLVQLAAPVSVASFSTALARPAVATSRLVSLAAPRTAGVAAAPAPLARGISVKRRRAKKMNKHKYEKMKKLMRRKGGLNLKQD